MNQAVIEKSRELAALIAASEEYVSMRMAEDAATKDEAVTDAYAKYQEKHQELEALSAQDAPDFDKIGAVSRELEELQSAFQAIPMAKALQNARKGFTDMMDAVNHELQKVLQPDYEEGCGGHCESCSGCHH